MSCFKAKRVWKPTPAISCSLSTPMAQKICQIHIICERRCQKTGKKGNLQVMEHSDVTVMLKGDLCHFPDHNYHGVLKPFMNNSRSSLSLEGVWLSGSKGLPVFYSFFPLSARVQCCTEDACVCVSVCLFDFFRWSTAKRLACVFAHVSQLISAARTVIWRSFVLRRSSKEIYSWNRPLAQKSCAWIFPQEIFSVWTWTWSQWWYE